MFTNFFHTLDLLDQLIWEYLAFALIIIVGTILTIRGKGYQFRVLRKMRTTFRELSGFNNHDTGTNPIKLYFASIGGMIGLGNVATVTAVVTMGGPGGIFWMWLAVIVGMMIKYADIYLGVTYRKRNSRGGYDGGPMHYLRAAYGNSWLPKIYALLLCFYGVEISQFVMITETVSDNFMLDRLLVTIVILGLILLVAIGGVKRLAEVCSWLMPPFVLIYILLALYVLGSEYQQLFAVFPSIFSSAFSGHEAIAGFAGSTMLTAAHFGASKAVYSGDIGIGYDSIIHSETKADCAKKQARLSIISLLTDCIICTLSCLLVLVSGLWQSETPIKPTEYIQRIFSDYFPQMEIFMTILFFLASFTTIIAFLVVGMKAAKFLNKKIGEKLYFLYALITFSVFAFAKQEQMITLMSVGAGFIMLINLPAIYLLRHKLQFRSPK